MATLLRLTLPRALALVAALAVAVAALAVARLPAAAAPPEPLISLDTNEADLPGVLKILAEKGGLNIITGPGVTGGKITIHMKDVPVDQAVNLVVRAAGLAYERIGNSILVADAKSLQEETGLSSYIVELKYANAGDVKESLKDLSGEMQVDKSGNRLIVVTSPRIIAEIEEVVRVLDVPAQQVMLEARVVEVSTDAAKKLGIDWAKLSRQGFVIVEGSDSLQSSAQGQLPENLPFLPPAKGEDLFKLQAFSRQAQAFQVSLDLLITDGSARVLANPRVATLNGHEATMLVGQRIPYEIAGTAFSGGGAAPVLEIQKEEVGIKLRITPLINADGFITTSIAPEVSSVIGFRGRNNDLPVVSTRQSTTTVRLKDGNTVIIGGLLAEDKTKIVTKVPLLGDIPMLGLLFQHQETQTRKTDLVIEVTPRIMPEQR